MKQPIRILCVDDHAFLVDGLQSRLGLEDDFQFVGRLAAADDLMEAVKRTKPDVVLLDIEMPGQDPFEAAADMKRVHPDVRTIILSAYVRDHYISAALKAGVWGYFSKADDAAQLIDGIRKVMRDEFAFGPKVQERCKPARLAPRGKAEPAAPRLEALTPREMEVLRMIGRGMSRHEMAATLSRSPKTVDGHRERIMQKLDIHDRGELVRFAIREGLAEA